MLQPNVTITAAAEKFIRRMVRFSEHPGGGFRLCVSPGGCSGYSSEFTIEAAPKDGDSEMLVGGVKVYLPAESRLVLDGVTVDFADTPTKSGLTFFNPLAAASSCSSSAESSAPPARATISLASIGRKPALSAGH